MQQVTWWMVFGTIVAVALAVVLAGRPLRLVLKMFGARAVVDGGREVDIKSAKAGGTIAANAERLRADTLEAKGDIHINTDSPKS